MWKAVALQCARRLCGRQVSLCAEKELKRGVSFCCEHILLSAWCFCVYTAYWKYEACMCETSALTLENYRQRGPLCAKCLEHILQTNVGKTVTNALLTALSDSLHMLKYFLSHTHTHTHKNTTHRSCEITFSDDSSQDETKKWNLSWLVNLLQLSSLF